MTLSAFSFEQPHRNGTTPPPVLVRLADGSVVYSPDAATPLLRVSENGGQPQNLTTLRKETRDRTHRWPAALPDGRAVLFTSDSIDTTEYYDDATIEAVVVATGERKTVLRVGRPNRWWSVPRLSMPDRSRPTVEP